LPTLHTKQVVLS
jgi:hypothetical protein